MKKGFTMSELMIAMAVLGILLAMVIPTLVNTRPDEFKMLTKKAYYVTEQVVSSLINDPVLYPDNTMYCNTADIPTGEQCTYGFEDTSKVQYNGEDFGDDTAGTDDAKKKFARLFAEQLNVVDKVDETGKYIITTSDGMTFDFSTDTNSPVKTPWTVGVAPKTNYRNIIIDVNGDKAPNCLETDTNCSRPDQFRIVIYSNGRIHIHEDDEIAIKNVMLDTKVN